MAITNQRRYAARTVPLAEVKRIAERSGVSLNDVVMGTVAVALRQYFIGHRELPARSLSAAVPVSLRAAGDESANTKAMVGRMKAAIPTDCPMFAAPASRAAASAKPVASPPRKAMPSLAAVATGKPAVARKGNARAASAT